MMYVSLRDLDLNLLWQCDYAATVENCSLLKEWSLMDTVPFDFTHYFSWSESEIACSITILFFIEKGASGAADRSLVAVLVCAQSLKAAAV